MAVGHILQLRSGFKQVVKAQVNPCPARDYSIPVSDGFEVCTAG